MTNANRSTAVILSSKQLTDSNIQCVIREALVEEAAIVLNLSYNKITHEGLSIRAEALRNNTV